MTTRKTSLESRQRWMRERLSPNPSGVECLDANVYVFERHYTPKELAQIWHLDESTVRRMFEDEPGVLKIGKANRRDGKRDYVSIRIPQSVALRVHGERSQ